MMENQTNYYDKIEIWISTHLSTFEPEFGNFLSTPRLSQKKGVLIKKSVYFINNFDIDYHFRFAIFTLKVRGLTCSPNMREFSELSVFSSLKTRGRLSTKVSRGGIVVV